MSTATEVDEFSPTHCDCCQEDIPGLGIECLQCSTQLCCECFGLGAEIGQHKSQHRYRFFDSSGDLFLYPKDPVWTFRKNLKLLDSIEMFGHRAWGDITNYIKSDIAETKMANFVDSKTGKITWPLCQSLQPKVFYKDVEIDDDGGLRSNLDSKLTALLISSEEATKLGCMSLTDNYEVEYDNNAEEELVSQLKYSADDEEIEFAIKLMLVDIYTTSLRERMRRKRVIRDYQLVREFFKKKSIKHKLRFSTDETYRDILEALRPFTQFYTANEYTHIVQNMVKERELIVRIQELRKYRQNGITKAEDCVEFDKISTKSVEKLNLNGKSESRHSEDSGMKSRKRKRRRLLLSHQKSHTAEVLHRIHVNRLHKNKTLTLLKRRNGTNGTLRTKHRKTFDATK